MKNLLIITLFFFSIGAMAEENYRCKFFKICFDKACSTNVTTSFDSLKVNEGWFKNELIYNGKDVSKNTLFGDNILHWGTYPFGDKSLGFSKYSEQFKFDKTSLILRGFVSFIEPQTKGNKLNFSDYTFLEQEYLCEEIN